MSAPRWLRAYLWGLACRACGSRPDLDCRCGLLGRWTARAAHWRHVAAARAETWRGRGVV